jgi:uncharacterized protein YecE (DUF72 family)
MKSENTTNVKLFTAAEKVKSEVLLGTCGWSYAEWEGIFYPEKQSKLKQYSSIFPTTEIDSTFYALPKDGAVLGWARYTPPNFIFSAKLPQVITHKKVLDIAKNIETDLNQFIQAMKPLIEAGKLGCILVQLPPFLRFDLDRLDAFLSLLPDRPSFAVEFRNASWLRDETFKLLQKYQVAYTIVDEPPLGPDIHVTSDLAYIRWHGRGEKPWFNYKYSQKELQEWVPKIMETAEKAERVLGYFNNHFHGYAPENCLQITEMLGIVTPHGTAAKWRLTLHRSQTKKVASRTLETWTGPIGEKRMEELLLKFSGPDVLAAAKSIPDSDFSLREDSRQRLAAYLGDTTVDVDLEKRIVIHRCPTWWTSILNMKFCPHVTKLFLSVDPQRASGILSLIDSSLDSWKFESRLAGVSKIEKQYKAGRLKT